MSDGPYMGPTGEFAGADPRELERLKAQLKSTHALCDQWERRYGALQTEVERLRIEGTPGVLHEVDQAFYRLAVKERDYERGRVERLEQDKQILLDDGRLLNNRIEELERALREAKRTIAAANSEMHLCGRHLGGRETT